MNTNCGIILTNNPENSIEITRIADTDYEVRTSDSSVLVIAKKKIILPDNDILVENFTQPSLSIYKQETGDMYAMSSSGILLRKM